MNNASVPVVKDIVLIGGGHSHVTVLKRFGMKPVPGVRLTLISPDAHTPYSGMLPGLIAGHYTYDEAHIDLIPLCRFAQARFVLGEVVRVDPLQQHVLIDGRPPIAYDLLSINSGSSPDPAQVPGGKGRVIPVKPVAQFLEQWEQLKQRLLADPSRRVGVIGAGAGGVELALSAEYAIAKLLAESGADARPRFHIVTQSSDILPTHAPGVRERLATAVARRGITLHTNFTVERVDRNGVAGSCQKLELDDILWVTGANAPSWIARSGLDVDEHGFLKVEPTLQSISHPTILAAGDIASVAGYPRPKSGVFAVRQGPPLEANLRRMVLGQAPQAFRPQSAFLSLISTGGKHAVASRGRWCASGEWVWRWKDHIDRSFMDKFNKLPEMSAEARPAVQKLPAALASAKVLDELGEQDMRCGGCGAKVGAATLTSVLDGLETVARDDVVAGLDSPDDAAIIAPTKDKLVVQTVDSFRSMVSDPYVFGQITANHCLGDIYAMGGEPQSALAIATLPVGLASKNGELLMQVMAGAVNVLDAAGCALIGGHTGEGAELSLGFSITGYVDSDHATRKSGMGAGDTLILTKPLGTGTLFAAEMRAKAKGRWVQAAIASALQSNRQAAEILGRHGVNACTDVTGFGLVGHLAEMLIASAATAELALSAIPAIDGAQATLRAGIVSSLQRDNRLKQDLVSGLEDGDDRPQIELLFDPQTAGGLLASVPSERAADCLAALHAAGYADAAAIGKVTGSVMPTPHLITVT